MEMENAMQKTILARLTEDYEKKLSGIFNLVTNKKIGNEMGLSNGEMNLLSNTNMLVLGVLTQLQIKGVIVPGDMLDIHKNIIKHVKTEHIGYTIQSFFNSNSKKGYGYGAKFKKILGQDVDRRVFIERNVDATRQCKIVNKFHKLKNICWICGGNCRNITQGGGSPPSAKRRRFPSKRRVASQEFDIYDGQKMEEEARKVAADAAEHADCRSPQCEHILPVCSGLMFLELASALTTMASSNVKEFANVKQLAKLEYRWSHSLCNNKKSDIPLINLDIQGNGNYFQIDETACAELSRKINDEIQENSALHTGRCNIIPVGIGNTPPLAKRKELTDITRFLNEKVTNSNIEKVYIEIKTTKLLIKCVKFMKKKSSC